MSDDPRAYDISDAELSVLRFLCANPTAPATTQTKSSLSHYAWRNADHAVIFQALTRLGSARTPAELREQLPAHLTRMGFPDVSHEIYFEGKIPKEIEIPNLVDRLLQADSPPR